MAGDYDTELIGRVAHGDKRAFENILEIYEKRAINFAYRFLGNKEDAEDSAQDAFLAVYENASKFKPGNKFSTWLFIILRNICINKKRSPDKKKTVPITEYANGSTVDIVDSNPSSQEVLERKELSLAIESALLKLPEDMRTAIILRKYDELSYDEIAEVLRCSANSARIRVHRAKSLLAKELLKFIEIF